MTYCSKGYDATKFTCPQAFIGNERKSRQIKPVAIVSNTNKKLPFLRENIVDRNFQVRGSITFFARQFASTHIDLD